MSFDEIRKQYFERLAGTPAGDATLLLESAITDTRGIQGAGFTPCGMERRRISNPKEEFADEIWRLSSWAAENSVPESYLGNREFGSHDTAGTEHWVWFEGQLVRKVSFANHEHFNQGPFGQTIEAFEDQDLSGKSLIVFENRMSSPSEYLERLYL